jgi:hypothetical protein
MNDREKLLLFRLVYVIFLMVRHLTMTYIKESNPVKERNDSIARQITAYINELQLKA